VKAKAIEAEFEGRGVRHGAALLLSERHALALIDRAAQLSIPIRAIDQVRPEHVEGYATIRGATPPEPDAWTSWDHARQFVRALAGRGLLFEVVLEENASAKREPTGYLTSSQNRAFVFTAVFVVGLAVSMVLFFLRMPR
jgi:hypothetical protein